MATASTNGYAPELQSVLPLLPSAPLQATVTAGAGQIMFYNASGDIGPTDGAVPSLVSAGILWPAKAVTGATVAGDASTYVFQGVGCGAPASTGSNDGFTKVDVCTPAFAFSVDAIGKKSNLSGVNRPLVGLVLGVAADGTPHLWSGPVAQTIARGLLIANASLLASFAIADAAASTTTAERIIPRAELHGLVTSVKFAGAAMTSDETDYVTATISKRDGAGGAAVVMATLGTRAANQGAVTALVPIAFALSAVAGALALLETDVVTLTVAKGGAGRALTGAITVNGKVI